MSEIEEIMYEALKKIANMDCKNLVNYCRRVDEIAIDAIIEVDDYLGDKP